MNFFNNLKDKAVTTFSAIQYIYSIKPRYIWLSIAKEFIAGFKVYPRIWLMKTAVDLLTAKEDFWTFFTSVTLLLLAILLLETVHVWLTKNLALQKNQLDLRLKCEVMQRSQETDYYTLSTEEYYSMQTKAIEAYDAGYIEKDITFTFSIVTNLILLFSLVWTVSSLGLLLLVPIGITVLVRALSEYFDRKANYIRVSEMPEVMRKSGYLHQICEKLRYAKEIRVFDLHDKFEEKLQEASDSKIKIWQRYMRVFRYSSVTYVLAEVVMQILIYLMLAYQVLVTHRMTVGEFVLFFNIYQEMQSVVGNLASNSIEMAMISNYLQHFLAYWNHPFTRKLAKNSGNWTNTLPEKFVIEFKNVCFRYPNTFFDALRNVNLCLESGKSYLVVGKNGAGKSTFIKLLCRLYQPTVGEITLNGKNIQDYDQDIYLSYISALFQDQKLLDLTVAENVTSFDQEVNEERLQEVLGDSGIADKIASLPKQEQSVYGKTFDEKGIILSGGEEKKLLIAKALYKKAMIRIFDEPAAGLDVLSENEIFGRLKQKMSQKGLLIYITHRLSTGMLSDSIIVFAEGELCEKGTHRELMAQQGIYATLYREQAALYQEAAI